ncbi:MAG: alpha/beta hydrolase domain-containing protein [Acidobacteriota bacterium]|nr:alpha/beta hydrolase domain-containing protein [Acidobacteriota bacterium]
MSLASVNRICSPREPRGGSRRRRAARRLSALAAVVLTGLAGFSSGVVVAEVDRIEISSRGPVAGGVSFGFTGPYEKLVGRAQFSLDPSHAANARVTDLDKAPRGEDGRVRFAADLHIIRPVDPARGNGTLLLEVPNRGRKAMVSYLNRGAARSADPTTAEEIGDGFLLRQGFTLVWVGWQHDVPREPDRMSIDTLVATDAGRTIEGLVRADHVFDSDERTMPLGHRGHVAYPVANPAHQRNVLTVRSSRLGARRVIPRVNWTFGRWENGRVVPDRRNIVLFGGFEKGQIYEAVYAARNPAVEGIGLTAVRDLVSHLKNGESSPAPAERAIGFGISQSGRFLRTFLYQGFNVDALGRRVFDGVIAHTAGAGRGSFNHRFAQPSRDAHPFSAFFYPTDIFPFTSRVQEDPDTGASDGLLAAMEGSDAEPRVFFTNSSYEYWGRAASLIHTTLDGAKDVEPLPNERIYNFAGTQHFVDRFPPERAKTVNRTNPADFRFVMRALVVAMNAWVAEDVEPPPSRMPRHADHTLVSARSLAFPLIPDTRIPRTPHEAYRVDYGPRFEEEGIVEWQPPRVGRGFNVLVPQVDRDGNEVGGLRLPEIAVPLATYTPWNWRAKESGGMDELADFRGSFLPFPRTRAERAASGDPRASIEERYPTRADYVGRCAQAAIDLVADRFLLVDDLPELIGQAGSLWDHVHEGLESVSTEAASASGRPGARTTRGR